MADIRIISQSEIPEALALLRARSGDDLSAVNQSVADILKDIQTNGDQALFAYTKKFDGFDADEANLMVSQDEIKKAYQDTDPKLIDIIKKAAENIKAFHQKQLRETWTEKDGGIMLGQLFNPVASCGVYVPGGKAVYPSSVLMNIIPAKVAGVENIYMATPPDSNGIIQPMILVASDIAGADKIFKMGGAQAIGAFAYGTASVSKVNKITGPGNAYVAAAKKQVFGTVGIDMIAGPSEVLVIDDGSVNPRFIAADVLSQAEHDELASCIAVVMNQQRAEVLQAEITAQVNRLPKKEIAVNSLKNYGMIVVVDGLDEAIAFANRVAPEHLELCIENAASYLPKIRNAGAVFLGAYSPEPLGDYFAGPNHILPTNGTAAFSSPLNVDDFMKKTSIIGYDEASLRRCYQDIAAFAEAEELDAHARSVRIRFEE